MKDARFEFVTSSQDSSEQIVAPHYSYWRSVARQFFSKRTTVFLLALLIALCLMAFIQPLISGYDPMETPNINNPDMRFLGISLQYPYGTDGVGNSVWDAVWAGTKTSLLIGFIVTIVNTVIGVFIGALWGFSKTIDKVMIEIYNIISSVPNILIVTVLLYVFGRGFWQLVLAMCLTGWLSTAYFIRTQVMIIRDREYNVASSCLGTPVRRIITRNIMPYLVSVVMTSVSLDIPAAISTEVTLSFLGIGLNASVPSLGRMINQYSNYFNGYPHLFWAPVLTLAAITVSLYVIGQALADASDPKTHL